MAFPVYIGLGSNIRAGHHLREATRLLGEVPGLAPTAASPVYRTPPWGDPDQDDFLNAVLEARTTFEPPALLERLLGVERRLERVRTRRWGPRTIDLDLLFYEQQVIRSERLTVPHPLLHERAFVLVPLCDLAPDLRHPVLGRTARELLAQVDRAGIEPAALRLTVPGAKPGGQA